MNDLKKLKQTFKTIRGIRFDHRTKKENNTAHLKLAGNRKKKSKFQKNITFLDTQVHANIQIYMHTLV